MNLTEQQQRIWDLWHGGAGSLSGRAVAKELNIGESAVRQHIKRIEKKIPKEGADPSRFAPGSTTQVDENGDIKQQWVRTDKQKESIEALQEAFHLSVEDSRPLKPIKAPKGNIKNLLTVYPMGDPHIGMYAYHKEAGEDFDCDIAERDLLSAVDYLISVSPPTEEALIVNLGDYFHGDSSKNTTTAGTPIDFDGRYERVLKIGISILIRVVERALEKHKKVTVINATGNHDTESSIFLCVAMWHHFQNNKRVEIRDSNMFHFFEFGKNLIGVCHGHTVKKERLPGLMAMDKPEAWGRTLHRYWYTGHIHHKTILEVDSTIIESFRTMAAKDAWHHGQGYRAGRDMNAIVIHKQYGETDRHRCDILRARA